jgi:hypothetical protein
MKSNEKQWKYNKEALMLGRGGAVRTKIRIENRNDSKGANKRRHLLFTAPRVLFPHTSSGSGIGIKELRAFLFQAGVNLFSKSRFRGQVVVVEGLGIGDIGTIELG